MNNRNKNSVAPSPSKAANKADEIMQQFESKTFEEKVEIFTKLRDHMKGAFELQYKAHEERAQWIKAAYENLMRS